jgi:titin
VFTNGTTYTFKVAAKNVNGTGPQSPAGGAVIVGTPAAPAAPAATPGNAKATVSWAVPSNNGFAISGYVVTPFIGTTAQTATTFNTLATTQPITGLTNGTTYTFKVAAKNAKGTGAQSPASAAVTVGAPVAPAAPTATAGNANATVSWAAPANNGSAIAGYVVTPFVGTTAQGSVTFNSTATTQTITALTNGTTYTFKVAAKNVNGTGPQSPASNAVTPVSGSARVF